MSDSSKAKFITPPNRLKSKVGSGGISEERLRRAQIIMDDFEVDFRPVANEMADTLEKATNTALKELAKNKTPDRDKLVFPVMQIKANGGMFKYQLLTDVADICLQFMEAVDEYNKEAIEIIKAHESTIMVILKNDLRGDGGKEGYALVQELHEACQRYFKKYKV